MKPAVSLQLFHSHNDDVATVKLGQFIIAHEWLIMLLVQFIFSGHLIAAGQFV